MQSKDKLENKFLDLIHTHQGMLYRISMLYEAEYIHRDDLLQEMLLQLWRSFPSFKHQATFATWMYRVALNTALMHQRKQVRNPLSKPVILKNIADDEQDSQSVTEEIDLLYQSIRELPRLDRAIILLKLENNSYHEISEITGISAKNVSARLARNKPKLRKILLDKGYREDIQQ
ncbi:RNA polymerase sigma factor [Candidatus Neomarinimicrobiota bacterium]